MDNSKLEELQRKIDRRIDLIVNDLDDHWIDNYYDSYLTHLCESAHHDPSDTVEKLVRELDSANRTRYPRLSGEEIVEILTKKLSDDDIVDLLTDQAIIVEDERVRSTHLEIETARVGEFEYDICIDDHPELAELVAQLPEDHEDLHRSDWQVYGHPCSGVSLVIKADTFLDSVSAALDEALLDRSINDLLDEEQAI